MDIMIKLFAGLLLMEECGLALLRVLVFDETMNAAGGLADMADLKNIKYNDDFLLRDSMLIHAGRARPVAT